MFSVSLDLTFFLSSVSLCPEFSLLPVASSVERNQKAAEKLSPITNMLIVLLPREKNAGTWQSPANLPRGAVREKLFSLMPGFFVDW